MTVDDGYHFLDGNVDDSAAATRSVPATRALYVGRQGAGVRVQRGRLVVEDRDESELLSIPTGHVDRLVLAGAVGLSAGARSWALYNGVEVVFLSRRGSYLGSLHSGRSDSGRLRAQLAAVDDPALALPVARAFIRGKMANQRALLMRFSDPGVENVVTTAVAGLAALQGQVDTAEKSDVLLGIEGVAARFYWGAYSTLLPEVGFTGRARQPPPDLVNAALGYGYAILLGECVAACRATGLDPSFGFLHSEDGRRPSLGLDLMEELRPLVVDQVVAELVRRRHLTASETRSDTTPGAVLLNDEGRRTLTAGIEDRLLTTATYVPTGNRVTYRRMIHLQAAALVRTIRHGNDYEPLRWR